MSVSPESAPVSCNHGDKAAPQVKLRAVNAALEGNSSEALLLEIVYCAQWNILLNECFL